MSKVNAHPASQRGVESSAPLSLQALRVFVRALRRVSRPSAVRLLTRLFVTPRRHALPERERRILEAGRREDLRVNGQPLAVWRFPPPGAEGETHPVVVLVHGWEGRGAQLGRLVEPLCARGLEVVLFDHVGHGASPGRRSSLIAMREALAALTHHVGVARLRGFVAHSMGTAAVTLALDQVLGGGGAPPTPRESPASLVTATRPRLVYIAPPYDLVAYFGHYLELVAGDQDLLPDMLRNMERRAGTSVEDIHYDNLLPRRKEPLLVLHSTDDQDVPVEAGRAVAAGWPGASFRPFEGLGHRRILRDADVIACAVEFLMSAPVSSPPA